MANPRWGAAERHVYEPRMSRVGVGKDYPVRYKALGRLSSSQMTKRGGKGPAMTKIREKDAEDDENEALKGETEKGQANDEVDIAGPKKKGGPRTTSIRRDRGCNTKRAGPRFVGVVEIRERIRSRLEVPMCRPDGPSVSKKKVVAEEEGSDEEEEVWEYRKAALLR
ncbi:hypothetical protein C8R42DRAFT_714348 [Lentinula raphanica]|nr:hypothetical protein C8R42DRAFT_714348 [Lentinula raphanica]